MSLIKDCLTAKDGESYDVARVLLFAGGIAFICLSVYGVLHGKEFDPDKYGTGLGVLLGGGGLGIGCKGHTEPE